MFDLGRGLQTSDNDKAQHHMYMQVILDFMKLGNGHHL